MENQAGQSQHGQRRAEPTPPMEQGLSPSAQQPPLTGPELSPAAGSSGKGERRPQTKQNVEGSQMDSEPLQVMRIAPELET